MDFSILLIFKIFGALGLFIFGMKTMSDGIQHAAGTQLRSILSKITQNRFRGLLTGIITTSAIQSSSATTVMIVSFVNAGLITVSQSAGVIMGANIGTTITGWIIAIGGFELSLSDISIALLALAVPIYLRSDTRLKFWMEFLIGFSLLFLGLNFLKESIPEISPDGALLEYLSHLTSWGFGSRILFVLIGILFTMVIQSSSAAMGLTIAMCYKGWLPFDIAAAMVIGENIGTTVTAELAAIVGNVYAKRSARLHSLFNIIGFLWIIPIMPWFTNGIAYLSETIFNLGNPLVNTSAMPVGLALCHSAFNLLNALVLIGFTKYFVDLSRFTIKSKGKKERKTKLKYIDNTLRSPELSTIELRGNIITLGQLCDQLMKKSRLLLNTTNNKEQANYLKSIKKTERKTQKQSLRITEYIFTISKEQLTPKTNTLIKSYLNASMELKRIGEIFLNFSLDTKDKLDKKLWFTPDQRNNLNELFEALEEASKLMNQNLLVVGSEKVNLLDAQELELLVNKIRDRLKRDSLLNMHSVEFNIEGAMVYTKLYSLLEKVGDHIFAVSEALKPDDA